MQKGTAKLNSLKSLRTTVLGKIKRQANKLHQNQSILTSCAPMSLVFISLLFCKRRLIDSRFAFHSERPEIIGRNGFDEILLSPARTVSRSITHDIMRAERVSSVNKQFQLRSMNVKFFRLCTSGRESLSVKSRKKKMHHEIAYVCV